MSEPNQSAQEAPEQQGFWQYIGRALLLIVPIALAMMILAKSGLLYHFEMFGLDPLLRSSIYQSSSIRIVEITDDDYSDFFCETSPLDRAELKNLILGIAKANPNLLVVDLDVTPTKMERETANFSPLPVQIQKELEDSRLNTTIIWPQTIERPNKSSRELKLSPLPPSIQEGHLGVPLFPREPDGTVRGYLHFLPVESNGLPKFWPSLPWAAVRGGTVSPKNRDEKEKEEEKLYFNFSADRYAFGHTDAGSILRHLDSPDIKGALQGKIVILGGNYAAARDEYFTPIGPIPGVDLVAYAMETEFRGGGMRELQKIAVFFVDVLLGCLLATVAFHSKNRKWATALVIALAVLLPFVGSYLVFRSWNLWLGFLPVILGALLHIHLDYIHELKEKAKHHENVIRIKSELEIIAPQ